MSKNYFRTQSADADRFFVFDDNSADATRRAYNSVLAIGVPVVYKMPKFIGPWRTKCELVGFRSEAAIYADLTMLDKNSSEYLEARDELLERRAAVGANLDDAS